MRDPLNIIIWYNGCSSPSGDRCCLLSMVGNADSNVGLRRDTWLWHGQSWDPVNFQNTFWRQLAKTILLFSLILVLKSLLFAFFFPPGTWKSAPRFLVVAASSISNFITIVICEGWMWFCLNYSPSGYDLLWKVWLNLSLCYPQEIYSAFRIFYRIEHVLIIGNILYSEGLHFEMLSLILSYWT